MDQDHADHSYHKNPPGEDSALIWRVEKLEGDRGANDESEAPPRRPWRAEMTRWLLTLNPGRTQDEYAKAVRYFFETTGVPQDLDEVTADLLLAYRGALAMRAERGQPRRPSRASASSSAARLERIWGRARQTRSLPGDSQPSDNPSSASHQTGPLAPATVNIRLTALRQFLRFAILREPIMGLTPEHVQMALRRLPVERRRPYQILSEEEWPAFLAAARLPLDSMEAPSERPVPATPRTSPWGHTRAERQRARLTAQSQTTRNNNEVEVDGSEAPAYPHPHRTRGGRTGARTALRDHALVALALTTGLRAIELSLLDMGDLTHERRRGQDEWWLTLPDEKTKGQRGGRTLPLAPELIAALLDYIHSTGRSLNSAHDRATPLFLALARGAPAEERVRGNAARDYALVRRLRPEQIRSVINRIETQWIALQSQSGASFPQSVEARRISPHALRHSAAIALLKGNEAAGRPPASVEHVRGWLGHFDIRTTQRYLDHLNSREERRKFTIAPSNPFASSLSSEVGASDSESEREME